MNSISKKLACVSALFLFAVILLVSYKLQHWPWQQTSLGSDGVSASLPDTLKANLFQIGMLALVATNGFWYWLYSAKRSKASGPRTSVVNRGSQDNNADQGLEKGDGANSGRNAAANQQNSGAGQATDGSEKYSVEQVISRPVQLNQPGPVEQPDAQLRIATAEVARIRKELIVCQARLDIANKSQTQFMAKLSRQFRTPMNSILGMSELLANSNLPGRESRFAAATSLSANSLLNVVDDLMDYSRLESGGLELENARFNLRDRIEEVCSSLVPMANEKDIRLLCYVNEDLPAYLHGDAARIGQIARNLISNAIEHTDEGEVVFRLSAMDADNGLAQLRIDVQDTGEGIAPEKQAQLYRALSNNEPSPDRSVLGIGLATARALVAMHGGEITFKSRVGEGTRLSATAYVYAIADEQPHVDQQRMLPGATALVVNDAGASADALLKRLGDWGIATDSVHSADAALQKLQHTGEHSYDVLIINAQMESIDAVSLASRIHNNDNIHTIKTLLLNSDFPDIVLDNTAAVGIHSYLNQPVRAGALHDALKNLMPRQDGSVLLLNNHQPAATPANCRVLLAEDNRANQEVARNMLMELGCMVSVARNGLEAVELTKTQSFDVILMDCEMPVMDGFEALANIRGSRTVNATTPVIALTANAMQGDRKNCLDRGMTDYLSKPMRQAQLQSMLIKWAVNSEQEALMTIPHAILDANQNVISMDVEKLRRALAKRNTVDLNLGSTVTAGKADGSVVKVSLINNKAIGVIRSLQRPGKPDLLATVSKVFFEKAPEIIQSMRDAYATGDMHKVVMLANSMKSSSAYLGADCMSITCIEIDTVVGAGDHTAVPALIDSLNADYASVVQELNQVMKAA